MRVKNKTQPHGVKDNNDSKRYDESARIFHRCLRYSALYSLKTAMQFLPQSSVSKGTTPSHPSISTSLLFSTSPEGSIYSMQYIKLDPPCSVRSQPCNLCFVQEVTFSTLYQSRSLSPCYYAMGSGAKHDTVVVLLPDPITPPLRVFALDKINLIDEPSLFPLK